MLYRVLLIKLQRTIRYNCELKRHTISKIKDDQIVAVHATGHALCLLTNEVVRREKSHS